MKTIEQLKADPLYYTRVLKMALVGVRSKAQIAKESAYEHILPISVEAVMDPRSADDTTVIRKEPLRLLHPIARGMNYEVIAKGQCLYACFESAEDLAVLRLAL